MQCFINGIEYGVEHGFEICEQAGNKTSSTVSVLVEDQPAPVSGDVIQLMDGETTVFWGLCGIPKSPRFDTGREKRIYNIVCQNANGLLAYRIVNDAWQSHSVSYIVQDLYTKYIAAEGIALGNISNIGVTMEVYTAKNYNLQTVLNELADLVGATWKIDSDRKFYFLAAADFPKFPRTVSMDFLLGGGLQHSIRDYKTRTVQYISGATDVTAPQTETYFYDGEQKVFTLGFPVAKKPVIYVNGTQVDPSMIEEEGYEGDAQIVFTWSYNNAAVRYKSREYLPAGATVVFDYVGYYPIRVVSYNATKIAELGEKTGTSGMRENVYIASDITTTKDALQLADSLLLQYSEATHELSFFMLSSQLYEYGLTLADTEVLTQMTFDLPGIGVAGDFVITERRLTPAWGDMGGPEAKYRVDLKLMSRDYLKSYGETISALYRDISQLTVRSNDVVVAGQNVPETVGCREDMAVYRRRPFMPIANPQYGTQFAQMGFGLPAYPAASSCGISGDYETPQNYPTAGTVAENGSLFAICDLGNQTYTG